MKRFLYISLIVIVVLVAAVFFLLQRNQPAAPASPGNTTGSLPQTGTPNSNNNGGGTAGSGTAQGNTTSGSPTVGGAGTSAKFGVVSNEPVLDYFVDAQNNVVALEPDGKMALVTNGQASDLDSAAVQNLIEGALSHDGKKAFVNYGDPGNPQMSVFDVAGKTWTPLATGMLGPVWSPADYRIAYFMQNKDGTESIMTLDASKATNKPVALITLNIGDAVLSWPSRNQLVIADKPSAYTQGSAWIFDLSKKTLTPEAIGVFGLETGWSNATSTVGLLFESGGHGGTLSLLNPSTGSTQALSLSTLPSKCLFTLLASASSTSSTSASSTKGQPVPALHSALYCAVPQGGLFANARLPEDYEEMALFTTDAFYSIDLVTGDVNQFFSPTGGFDAQNLKLFNGVLFFTNRYDQKLYAITLAK